ncbi:Cytosolic carboxypeptidase 2 [Fasciolopsis buskii]|uniref:Cytosolic carboxypeptidase 2 n=1 Tax=Fasciolopsis buskii TaxID=27845 RepID=A0A8E0RIV3_9TREM|nr:Cytosolic carboxypeptidase 2 [Fasciolopsis buski]
MCKFSDEKFIVEKPKNIFKTKQIYYALSERGTLDAKLSQPRPLNTEGVDTERTKCLPLHKIQWPANMQVIPQRVLHKKFPPKPREALYRSSGKEKRPLAVGLSQGGALVYNYCPEIGKYLDSTRPYGSITTTSEVKATVGDCLQFESRFESGNLQKAIRVGLNDYELYLRPDLYTSKYTQWFYFRVSNTIRSRRYRFTVVNFYKEKSLFSQGMRPLMYSEKEAQLTQKGWIRVGNGIQYYRTQWNIQSFTNPPIYDNQIQSSNNFPSHSYRSCTSGTLPDPVPDKARTWYSLTWTCELPHDDDVVYFASCYPYTYSQLQDYLTTIRMNPYQNKVCEQTQLCTTLAGNSVPLLTVTEPERRVKSALATKSKEMFEQSDEDPVESDPSRPIHKQCVVITARVHPGETQSSWMVQGLLEYLLSKHPDAELLRANFVFKIVPMLNPDGVIVGNYRCSLSGCDLNRKYTSSLKRFFPTVWHTRQMVLQMMCSYPVLVYCDLHGHSRKQQMFVYGCRSADPSARLNDRVFPLMLSRNAPELFDYSKCRFGVQRDKEGTGRISMWREGIANSYTLEATFCGFGEDPLIDGYHFNFMDYEKMGHQFCETLLDFCDPDVSKRELILAELERIRNCERARQGSSTGGSLSDYSSDECSDTGSDSSNCDDLPAYYIEVLQKVCIHFSCHLFLYSR